MATPIKDTPVLTGKDARNFEAWMKENEGKKVSPEEIEKSRAVFQRVTIIDKRENINQASA
jgi:hypothetical protein